MAAKPRIERRAGSVARGPEDTRRFDRGFAIGRAHPSQKYPDREREERRVAAAGPPVFAAGRIQACDPDSRGAHGLQLDESERRVLAANAQVDNLKVQMDGLRPPPKVMASTITALSRSDSSQPTSAAAPSAPQQAAAAVSPNVAPGQSSASRSMGPPPPRPRNLPSTQRVSAVAVPRQVAAASHSSQKSAAGHRAPRAGPRAAAKNFEPQLSPQKSPPPQPLQSPQFQPLQIQSQPLQIADSQAAWGCDVCECEIVGPRYTLLGCNPSYDLCSECYAKLSITGKPRFEMICPEEEAPASAATEAGSAVEAAPDPSLPGGGASAPTAVGAQAGAAASAATEVRSASTAEPGSSSLQDGGDSADAATANVEDTAAGVFHERVDLTGGLGRTAAGGRRAC